MVLMFEDEVVGGIYKMKLYVRTIMYKDSHV